MLVNQFKILEALYPKEAQEYYVQRKALEKGYALQYDFISEHLYDELSKEECKEVLEILNLYRALNFSYNQIPKGDEEIAVDGARIEFPGFDGNNEGSRMSYTQYFIHDLGRFQELTEGREFEDFNSHSQKLGFYRKQVAKWHEFDRSFSLSAEQLNQIINVAEDA